MANDATKTPRGLACKSLKRFLSKLLTYVGNSKRPRYDPWSAFWSPLHYSIDLLNVTDIWPVYLSRQRTAHRNCITPTYTLFRTQGFFPLLIYLATPIQEKSSVRRVLRAKSRQLRAPCLAKLTIGNRCLRLPYLNYYITLHLPRFTKSVRRESRAVIFIK